MSLVEVLLGLLTVMTTIVLAVVGTLYQEIIRNVKPDLQAVKHTLYGTNQDTTDDGLVEDVEEVGAQIERHADLREQEHQQTEDQLQRLRRQVDAVISALRRQDDIDINVQTNQRQETPTKEND